MEKQLQPVTIEQAKRLRKAGFKWDCLWQYNEQDECPVNYRGLAWANYNGIGEISAPTVALALKWFRDEKELFGCVFFAVEHFRKGYYWNYFSFEDKNVFGKTANLVGDYEQAESALLDELLKLLEDENKTA
jgi:hypothetical protein